MKKRKTAGPPVNPNAVTGFEALHDPDRRNQALTDLGQWVIDTCLIFGCQPEIAWQAAATFTKGLRRELESQNDKSKEETK